VPRKDRWNSQGEDEQLGAFLRQLRIDRNIGTRDLARRLGRRHSFVQKIEEGSRQVQVLEFIEICRLFGLPPTEALAAFEKELDRSGHGGASQSADSSSTR